MTASVAHPGAYLGELATDGLDDQPLIDRIASLIGPYSNHSQDAE